MINNVGIIVRRPVGDERATLGIRTAYATQVGGYPTCLVLLEDGVYCLVGALPEYDRNMINMFQENEGRLACLGESLEARGISPEKLSFSGVEILDRDDLAELAEDSDSLNLF